MVRFCLPWHVVGMVGATTGQINLPQLYSQIGDDLQGDASELKSTFADQSFRSATWSSRPSSDLDRSVSRCVAGIRGYSRWRWRWAM
jgi:hypothetical protein